MVTLVETFAVGTFQCNCTIIADEASREAIVVDPGDEAPRIIERLRAHDLHVTYLVHTHAHIDHVMATTDVKRECGGKALLHPADNVLYDNLAMQGTFLGIQDVGEHDPMDGELVDGQSIALGDSIQLQVLHTPGHTQGSCCFHAELDGKGLVFSGDTLFMRGIGRTDLWGGSQPQLLESINQRLLPMDGDTLVVPGHGGNTTIGDEKLKNPFLR